MAPSQKRYWNYRASIVLSAQPLVRSVKIIEQGIDKSITTSATLVGALPYMAPEVISTPKKADKMADVWSAGAILYELMSGEKPFGAGLPAVSKIVGGKLPNKPTVYGNHIQFGPFVDQLWELVSSCLNPKPTSRPSADELVLKCGELCYSIQPRHLGTISRYGRDQGAFGFIAADGFPNGVFFHRDSYYGFKPKEGQKVTFSCFDGGGAPRAYPVVPLK